MNIISAIQWDSTVWACLLSILASLLTSYKVARYISHLDYEKDHKNRKKDISIEFQASAYRKIAQSLNPTVQRPSDLIGEALEEFQIFGTKEQIALARKFAEDVAGGRGPSTKDLLKSLRKSIREALELDPIDEDPWHLRSPPSVQVINPVKPKS